MKWNMDMKCFFKSIGRKTRLFFSLLFVWGFSQSNIQAQTEIDLVNVDFTNPNFTGFAINTRLDISEFYQGAVGQYAWFQNKNEKSGAIELSEDGLSFGTNNMDTTNYYAALSFEIPEGVNQITVEIKVPKKEASVRCRLHKGIISENGPSEMHSYVTLKDDDETGVISKVLTTYSNKVENNEIVENVDSVITPGNYIFYFGRSSSSYKLFESVRIYYTTTSSCTPLTISDGTSDITSLNLEKATSAMLSATTSDGTSVVGTWSVSNDNPVDIITVSGNTVNASSDATGSATLVFTPGDNTYCEAVIPVYVAEGDAPAPTVVGENFDNSTTSWCFGKPLTVTATSTSTGTGTFAYQWYKDSAAVIGQTQSNYSPEATGVYYCKVTYTESGYFPVMVESPHATITTLTPQIIPQVTGEGMYNIGETATLQVTASGGDGSYSYQWYSADNENGDGAVEVAGATSTDYSVSSTSAQTFYYFCEISSGACTETTDVQTVTFTEGPCYELIFTVASGTTWEGSYTVSGGTVNNSGDVKFTNDGFTFGGNSDLLTITLDQEIKEGTKIEITFSTNADDNNGRGISIRTSENDEVGKLTDVTRGTYTKSYIVGKDNPLIDQKQFILTRATGNNTYLKSVIVYCGKTCKPAGLAWSESEWTVEYGAQNPSFPTLENPNNLKSIQYSSSNQGVATIDATSGVLTIKGTGTTTITATFEGNETYCSESVSYTLTVTCSDPVPYISPESGAIECTLGVELSLYYQNADGTTTDVTNGTAIAWYQQDADGTWQKIDGATSNTYTATSAGIYKALVTDNCPQWTGNEAVVTESQAGNPPVVEKLTPFQYYQLDSIYAVTGREMRHLFKVTPKGTGDNPYQVSATIHRGSTISPLSYIAWITSKNNTDTIITDYNVLTAWSKVNTNAIQVGDTIVVKVTPRNMCNDIDVTYADSINIIVLNRSTHTIAYVVSGENVDDFLGVTSADIQDPLYTDKLVEMRYIPTAVNGYANYRFLNYEPFDLVLLTDYPKSDGKIGSGEENVGRAANLNDLADLVDRKPIFSLKAHMAALDKWQAKGFTGNPLTPSDNPQTTMTVLCYAHEMFKDINMGTGENKTITVTTGGGSDGGKALQGFATFDVVEFVNIATINGGTQGTLVACCERQKVVESRMMVLSINNTATQLITVDGYKAIGNILEYLLITDPIYVSDCSLVFTNGLNLDGSDRNVEGAGDGKWSNPLNWAPGFNMVPTLSHRVRIDKPCTVNVKAGVSAVSIRKDKYNNWEGSLTVEPGAKLAVAGRFREVRGRDFVNSYKIESEGSLTIETNETAAGAFMVYDSVAPYAQVEFYSKASGAKAPQQGTDVPTTAVWQYMAIPTSGYPQAVKPFEGAWMCRWDEANPNGEYPQAHWYVVRDNDKLEPFEGYALTQEKVTKYQLAGFLNVNDHTYKGLTYTQQTSGDNYTDGEKTYPKTYPGFHLLGNSFTAPIYLDSLKEKDFVNVEPTIYIYNAGTWNDWYDNDDVGDGNSTTAGQYMALPIHAGSYTGLNVIPAMQGFFVKATSGAGNGSVAIDYRNAVVRPNYYETTTTPPPVVRAPQKEKTEIPILKMRVEGKRFADELYLLCREDWNHAYEPGFDGKKIYGDSRTPQLFAIEADDNMSVNAVDDIDGQYLGFIAGEETEYTLTFDPSTLNGQYSRLYLHDLTVGTSIDLLASDSYSFSVGKKGETRRFLISSSATVNEEVDGGLLKGYAYDGVLYVENFTDSEGDWTIYDAVGRKIDSGTVPGLGRYSYTLNLPYGAYTVYLRTNSIIKPVKVVF